MLKLVNGVEVAGEIIYELPIAETTGIAETVYTRVPEENDLYEYFAEILSVSIRNIGKEPIAAPFVNDFNKTRTIPLLIKKLGFLDVGTLILQIHRECWEDVLPRQKLSCINCGRSFEAEVDLNKIIIPERINNRVTEVVVNLKKDYKIKYKTSDAFKEFKGLEFNTLVFRNITLQDALNNQGVATEEVILWRNFASDTLLRLEYRKNGVVEEVIPDVYKQGRAGLIFSRDLGTKQLRLVREGLQKAYPSANMYYEDKCPHCRKNTPYVFNTQNFFST